MIVLDTDVVSALCRIKPPPTVTRWASAHRDAPFVIGAQTLQEARFGIEKLPPNAMRASLSVRLAGALDDLVTSVLPYDGACARVHAVLRVIAMRNGRSHKSTDLAVASVALANDIPLATRNTRDFDFIPELALIDPWTAP